jgi:hypothetical protein
MGNLNDINRAGREGFVGSVWFVLIVVFVIGALTWVALVTKPWVVQREREVIQHSQQYVETQQEQLLLLTAEWETAPERSRPAIEQRMRQHVMRLQESGAEVPTQAQEILNR